MASEYFSIFESTATNEGICASDYLRLSIDLNSWRAGLALRICDDFFDNDMNVRREREWFEPDWRVKKESDESLDLRFML